MESYLNHTKTYTVAAVSSVEVGYSWKRDWCTTFAWIYALADIHHGSHSVVSAPYPFFIHWLLMEGTCLCLHHLCDGTWCNVTSSCVELRVRLFLVAGSWLLISTSAMIMFSDDDDDACTQDTYIRLLAVCLCQQPQWWSCSLTMMMPAHRHIHQQHQTTRSVSLLLSYQSDVT